jgi:LysR family glycine cleavage system transcriptional activator
LPPLNALKTLEAAGRLMSFARAADELNVTPGAVSRQIRTLEDILGFALFDRNHREVRLSSAGRAYVEALTDSFRQMERATRRLVEHHRQEALHVHIAITFTLRWLVPLLPAFHARHPRQQIRLSTAIPNPDELAASNDVSVQIRSEAQLVASSATLVGHRLFDIDLVPVCSPSLIAAGEVNGRRNALAGFTLLRSYVRPSDWGDWLTAAGMPDIDPHAGICFESSSLAYQAAIEGIGIAIAMRRLVEADLAVGRLVIPYDYTHPTNTSLCLLYSNAAASVRRVAEFREWLLAAIEPQPLSGGAGECPVVPPPLINPVPARRAVSSMAT